MATTHTTPTSTELFDETSNWLVGGGIVTLALFGLALPGVIILLIGAIPILLIGLAVGLVAAIVALPILVLRGLIRWTSRALRARKDGGSIGRPRSGGRPDRGYSSGTRSHAPSGV